MKKEHTRFAALWMSFALVGAGCGQGGGPTPEGVAGDTSSAPEPTADDAGARASKPGPVSVGTGTNEGAEPSATQADAGQATDSASRAREDSGPTTTDSGPIRAEAGASTSDAASATCSPGGGGGPTGGPTDMFPCDSYWYKDVSSLPAYTAEDAIGALGTWGNGNKFEIDFSILFMHASAGTPTVSVSLDPDYDPDNDHEPVPIPAGGAVEGESGYTCTGGGDCHLLVVDDAHQKLFELWQASSDNGVWRATEESMWNLTEHYGPHNRGKDCTSADAAGFALLPGLVGVKETVVDQEIKHALRFILPNDHMRPNSYVLPASHSADHSGPDMSPPMGTRLRLKSSFSVGSLPSTGAKVVARALQKYGMLLADGGEIALTAESDQLETTKWGDVLGPDDLSSLKVTDFEVVDYAGEDDYSSLNCVRSP